MNGQLSIYVAKQKRLEGEYQAANEKVKGIEDELTQLRDAITTLQDEYSEEEQKLNGERTKFDELIENINNKIITKNNEIEEARKNAEQKEDEIPAEPTGGISEKEKVMEKFRTNQLSSSELNDFISDENITDEELVDIIKNHNEQHVTDMKYSQTYSFLNLINENYDSDAKDIIYSKLLSRLENSYNNGNQEALNLLTQEFYNATKGISGTNEAYVDKFFDNLSDKTILDVNNNYSAVNNGEDMMENIKGDFSFASGESKYTNKLQQLREEQEAEKTRQSNSDALNQLKAAGVPEGSDLYQKVQNDMAKLMSENEGTAYEAGIAVVSSTPLIHIEETEDGEKVYRYVTTSSETAYDSQGNEL